VSKFHKKGLYRGKTFKNNTWLICFYHRRQFGHENHSFNCDRIGSIYRIEYNDHWSRTYETNYKKTLCFYFKLKIRSHEIRPTVQKSYKWH